MMMIWSCPLLQIFWSNVLTFIIGLTTIPIPQTVDVCMLGLVNALAPCRAVCTLLGLLLFYARKSIIPKWKVSSAPTLNMWRSLVNSTIPLCRETYLHRGCPKKFNKVWDIWLESDTTTNAQINSATVTS